MINASVIKNAIKKIMPLHFKKLYRRLMVSFLNDYALRSYSQEGEDMILRRLFEGQKDGFYIDIGAHHPKRFSNTYFFYKKEWKGINIDAMPGSMKLFSKYRPRDINIEMPISNKKQTIKYHIFNETALNTFSSELAMKRIADNKNYKIVGIKNMNTETLKTILDNYIANDQIIDFMSIDVEGFDYEVLISNDWKVFRPRYVLVEILNSSCENINNHRIGCFMLDNGYSFFAKTVNTVFFKDLRS